MNSTNKRRNTSRPNRPSQPQESDVSAEDGTWEKRPRIEPTSSHSLCNDRYFIMSATGDFHQSLPSVPPFLLDKALKTQAGSIWSCTK